MRIDDGAEGRAGLPLSPVEMDRWASLVADRVAERLAGVPRLVDRVRLAELLGVSVPTIERLTSAGELPIVRMGRRVLYDPAAVIEARTPKAKKGGAV